MNRLIKLNKDCPKGCWQNCEYSSECLAQARNSHPVKSIVSFGRLILGRLPQKNKADCQLKRPYNLIHPVTKYKFSCISKKVFVLDQHIGKPLFEIQTVHLEVSPYPWFSHNLKDDKGGVITELTFLPELERRACGTYDNHAILIELSEDHKEIAMLFFENMGIYQNELLQRWNTGKLVVEVEIKPLLGMETDKRPSKKCMHTNVYMNTLFKRVKSMFSSLMSPREKEPLRYV